MSTIYVLTLRTRSRPLICLLFPLKPNTDRSLIISPCGIVAGYNTTFHFLSLLTNIRSIFFFFFLDSITVRFGVQNPM